MNKKHISIIGSCVSRNLFNSTKLEPMFDVDEYVFQVCPWDIFSEGLDIDSDRVKTLSKHPFTQRTLLSDLNKTAVDTLKNIKSEYLMLDLTTLKEDVLQVSFEGKQACVVSQPRIKILQKAACDNLIEGLTVRLIKRQDVDKNLVKFGLNKLAQFIKENFSEEKVILNRVIFAKKYIDNNSKIIAVSDGQARYLATVQSYITAMEDYFLSLLPKTIVLKNENVTSDFGTYDNYKDAKPSANHFMFRDYSFSADLLIKKLGLDPDPYWAERYTSLTPIEVAYQKLKLDYLKLVQERNQKIFDGE